MTRLLALKVELICDVATGDLPETEAAIMEGDELARQIVARLRRVALGKRWTLRIDRATDPTPFVLKGQETPSETKNQGA